MREPNTGEELEPEERPIGVRPQGEVRRGLQPVNQVIAEMKEARLAPRLVRDWRAMIPEGSRWNPGDPGRPTCRICEGTGYVRLDLPVGHKYFGKLFACECAA